MSNTEITLKVEELISLEQLATELKEEIDSLKDCIKAEMNAQQIDTLEAGTHIIRYTAVLSNRFDSTAFKKDFADIYKEYTKQIQSYRFSIS